MARRRKRQEEHANHERWIVSYADFVTLLFAFFVVMYSISSVNEGKYRVLSQTFTQAFQESYRSLQPIQVGELARTSGESPNMGKESVLTESGQHQGMGINMGIDQSVREIPKNERQRLSFLAATIEDMLSNYIEQDLVDVSFSEDRVVVNMKDKMLFASASAHLSRAAVIALKGISQVLASVPNQIQVEGNTDNRPINTEEFPSNWELSAARAASVVHLMVRLGIEAERMSAVGYAEYRPVADNTTVKGRAKNRRVTLVILGMGSEEDSVINLPGSRQ
ncbi:MAG: flagellar motor protein MotD [Candidatus Thiodiazotropha sp.]|jgi:chemotaxis protein MotB